MWRISGISQDHFPKLVKNISMIDDNRVYEKHFQVDPHEYVRFPGEIFCRLSFLQ